MLAAGPTMPQETPKFFGHDFICDVEQWIYKIALYSHDNVFLKCWSNITNKHIRGIVVHKSYPMLNKESKEADRKGCVLREFSAILLFWMLPLIDITSILTQR